jgi:hypothetical protein
MTTLTRIAVTVLSLLIFVTACRDSAQEPAKATLNFSLSTSSGSAGGRVNESATPAAAIITVHDAAGNVIEDHYKIKLNAFGQGFISEPVIIDLNGQQNYFLSEFLILDANDDVLYATPKEGSDLARLVSDPLDIAFDVSANQTTTVTPEVLAVGSNTPQNFGYADFGFDVIEKIDVVISAFVQVDNGDQLSTAHIKVEGLPGAESTDVLWSYETELLAEANIVTLKKSDAYRITITKDGYNTWQQVSTLNQSSNLNVHLTKPASMVIYSVGEIPDPKWGHLAIYSKGFNEIWVLDNGRSSAADVAVYNDDVYTVGYRTSDAAGHNFQKACYWKNRDRVDFEFYGSTKRVLLSGSDLYIAGISQAGPKDTEVTTGFFIKNDVKTDVPPLTAGASVTIRDMYVEGSDVYLVGSEKKENVTKQLFWKNATVTELTQGFEPAGIAVKDGHVYIAGSVTGHASYMKDGEISITHFESQSSGKDIAVTANGDVYLLGSQGEYWRNGNYAKVPNDGVTPQESWAFSVSDTQICIMGQGNEVMPQGQQLRAPFAWRGANMLWIAPGMVFNAVKVVE